MFAEVDEELLQVQDVPHAEEGGHVSFEDFVDHVLAENTLAEGEPVGKGRLGEASQEQVATESREKFAEPGGQQRKGLRAFLEKVLRAQILRHRCRFMVPDLQVLQERQRGHRDRQPASDAAFGELMAVFQARGTGGRDAVFRMVVWPTRRAPDRSTARRMVWCSRKVRHS